MKHASRAVVAAACLLSVTPALADECDSACWVATWATSPDLGVVVYNAATEPSGRFLDIPLEEHRINIAVNCWTPTLLCYSLDRKMVERRRSIFGSNCGR